MHYVYVLKSTKDSKFYTGCAEDLRKRFREHNDGKVSSTKNRRPLELIYYEASLEKTDAFAREKYLKTGMGKRYLKNRLKRFLALTGWRIGSERIPRSHAISVMGVGERILNYIVPQESKLLRGLPRRSFNME